MQYAATGAYSAILTEIMLKFVLIGMITTQMKCIATKNQGGNGN